MFLLPLGTKQKKTLNVTWSYLSCLLLPTQLLCAFKLVSFVWKQDIHAGSTQTRLSKSQQLFLVLPLSRNEGLLIHWTHMSLCIIKSVGLYTHWWQIPWSGLAFQDDFLLHSQYSMHLKLLNILERVWTGMTWRPT